MQDPIIILYPGECVQKHTPACVISKHLKVGEFLQIVIGISSHNGNTNVLWKHPEHFLVLLTGLLTR